MLKRKKKLLKRPSKIFLHSCFRYVKLNQRHRSQDLVDCDELPANDPNVSECVGYIKWFDLNIFGIRQKEEEAGHVPDQAAAQVQRYLVTASDSFISIAASRVFYSVFIFEYSNEHMID